GGGEGQGRKPPGTAVCHHRRHGRGRGQVMTVASRSKVERQGWSRRSAPTTAPLDAPPLGGPQGGAVEHPIGKGGAQNFFTLPSFPNGRGFLIGRESFAGAGARHG